MNKNLLAFIIVIFSLCLVLDPFPAYAELSSGGLLNDVLQKYKTAAMSWGTVIQEKATWLFITLTAISMVWTFSQLMFHRSSFAELFGELIRFMVFTGFFLWLLRNGPKMATAIIDSFKQIGSEASSQSAVSPSALVDIGFKIFDKVCQESSVWSPVISAGCLVTAGIILVILALIGINMLLQLCSAWVLAYAGVFFLGFGGSKWTSDMAVNYFKTVLGLGASLMTMILLVGIGTGMINEYSTRMSSDMKLQELAVLLVASITLLLLVDKLPAMVAGIISGASIGSSGAASFGAGAAVGAAMTAGAMAMGSASKLGSAAVGAAANIAGLSQASKAAAQELSGVGGGGSLMGSKSPSATEIRKAVLGGAAKAAGQAVKQAASDRVNNSLAGKIAGHIKKS